MKTRSVFLIGLLFCSLCFMLVISVLPKSNFQRNEQILDASPTLTDKFKVDYTKTQHIQCFFPNATEAEETATRNKYGFGGTDLGIPVYDSTRNRMLIFFGDTFKYIDQSSSTNSFPDLEGNGKNWYSNVLAFSQDTDLSNGLDFSAFYTSGGITNLTNGALPSNVTIKSVIEGRHNNSERTKIPTGGVEINGTIYMFYFSKYSWDFRQYSMH